VPGQQTTPFFQLVGPYVAGSNGIGSSLSLSGANLGFGSTGGSSKSAAIYARISHDPSGERLDLHNVSGHDMRRAVHGLAAQGLVRVTENASGAFKVHNKIMGKLLVHRPRPVSVASHDCEPRKTPVKLPDLTRWL
jgi:hypothetical protein